ncbi:MAG: hypothetical protein ACYC6F_17920 [Longimicrobiales bacterium]
MDTAAVIELLTSLGPILSGLFGGAGAVLLWEGVLKPLAIRRRAAKVLGAEVSFNKLVMIAHRSARKVDRGGLPGDFHLATRGFDVVVDGIAELSVELLVPVLLFYERVRHLNAVAEAYWRDVDRWKAMQPGDERKSFEKELDRTLSVFDSGLNVAIREAEELVPKLRERAGLRRPKGLKPFSLEDFEQEAAEMVRARRQLGSRDS